MTGVYIAGWSHSAFGKLDHPDVESLIGLVVRPALSDAGISGSDIDGIFVGHFNSGFSKQNFPSSLAMQTAPELRFKPATRVENACASGSAAIFAGIDFIRSGRGKTALVIGVEKMTSTAAAGVAQNLLGASYWPEESGLPAGFVGVFAQVAARYFEVHGDQSDALAAIAAKNHRNGLDNPFAQLRKDLGFEFCRTESEKNPFVAGPLKRTDCSPVSDGAAALILTDADIAAGLRKAVHFRAVAHANDYLPMRLRDMSRFEAGERAWQMALQSSSLLLSDLSFVETHDCFTIAELIEYEAMGLAPRGQGARAILDGWTMRDGRLPINRSGGLKSKGHPVGATGVSMHVMAAMQLLGEAGAMQLPKADLGAVYNMGGSGVANYVSVLEPAGKAN
jgi:acetyl-CoA C-acetyltransferase